MAVSLRRRSLFTVLILALGCRGRGDGADSARSDAPPPPSGPAVQAGTYTLDDFRRLRWIEGQWRGFMPDGNKFYERYHFLDDSTIAMHSFPDSTFARPGDSSRVQLRGGTVSNGNAVATRLDSTGVDFAPQNGAGNRYTWATESASKWNATLRWTDAQGRPQTVVYALHRFGR